MHLLLDTHTFLWFITDDAKLSKVARDLVITSESVLLSAGSLWEMAIKKGLKKLEISSPLSFDAFITEQLKENAIDVLPIRLEHLEAYIHLPFHHRDPFDRLFIAQATVESLTILSKDSDFTKYDVDVRW
ncbi:MAG: type II toxin-antitoxin system VapC family toxin [Ignavibacteriae bacterium]|nr:type II toxin-antitoxin system VapC family toxin [Ignavibacteriota bacterium]MCB9214584.1 type II toxin-antitoxin system VapC family toxin [Ignavibacteria bacterium]